ncbi:MAG: hypothetical protein KDE58_09365, partial [Caldilineaceae bacterium]|nr:hypothetical protein [Caldilineaceae bacterium]
DPQRIIVTTVKVHKPQPDWLVLSNQPQPGLIRFALAGMQPVAQTISIATITGTVIPGVTTPVFQVERFLANEQEAGKATNCSAPSCIYLSIILR